MFFDIETDITQLLLGVDQVSLMTQMLVFILPPLALNIIATLLVAYKAWLFSKFNSV